jgi:hypothetical protein
LKVIDFPADVEDVEGEEVVPEKHTPHKVDVAPMITFSIAMYPYASSLVSVLSPKQRRSGAKVT